MIGLDGVRYDRVRWGKKDPVGETACRVQILADILQKLISLESLYNVLLILIFTPVFLVFVMTKMGIIKVYETGLLSYGCGKGPPVQFSVVKH